MRPVCLPLMKNFFSTRDHGCISLSLRFTELSTGSMYQVVFTTIAGISLPSGNTTFNCFVKDHPAPQTQHPLRSYSASVLMKTSVFTTVFFLPLLVWWLLMECTRASAVQWNNHTINTFSLCVLKGILLIVIEYRSFPWKMQYLVL